MDAATSKKLRELRWNPLVASALATEQSTVTVEDVLQVMVNMGRVSLARISPWDQLDPDHASYTCTLRWRGDFERSSINTSGETMLIAALTCLHKALQDIELRSTSGFEDISEFLKEQ